MKYLIFIILATVSLAACKDYHGFPEIPDGEPIFAATGTLNGMPLVMKVDGIHYVAESGFLTDTSDVFVYQGIIVKSGCELETCGPRLEVLIRGTENIDDDLSIRSYAFRNSDSTAQNSYDEYTITLSPEFTGDLLSCHWLIDSVDEYTTAGGAGLTLTQTSLGKSFIDVVAEGAFSGGCSSSIGQRIYLDNHACSATFSGKALSGSGHFLFTANAIGSGGIDYSWDFSSGATASSREVELFLSTLPTNGVETIELNTGSAGCEAGYVRNFIVDSGAVTCNLNINASLSIKTVQQPKGLDLGTVELIYADANGKTYRSSSQAQPTWADFKVLDVRDYRDAIITPGVRSKMITATANAVLRRDNESIELRDVELTIPLGLGL